MRKPKEKRDKEKEAESRQEAEDKALKRFEERWENARLDPAIKDRLKEAKKLDLRLLKHCETSWKKKLFQKLGQQHLKAHNHQVCFLQS